MKPPREARDAEGVEHVQDVHIGWNYCPCWNEAWAAGSAYERERARGLVEALEKINDPQVNVITLKLLDDAEALDQIEVIARNAIATYQQGGEGE